MNVEISYDHVIFRQMDRPNEVHKYVTETVWYSLIFHRLDVPWNTHSVICHAETNQYNTVQLPGHPQFNALTVNKWQLYIEPVFI